MKSRPLRYALFNSFIVTQILFFIDEGNYDFRWMADIGNWLVFTMYFATIAVMLYLINLGLERLNTNKFVILGINLVLVPVVLLVLCCVI